MDRTNRVENACAWVLETSVKRGYAYKNCRSIGFMKNKKEENLKIIQEAVNMFKVSEQSLKRILL